MLLHDHAMKIVIGDVKKNVMYERRNPVNHIYYCFPLKRNADCTKRGQSQMFILPLTHSYALTMKLIFFCQMNKI